MSRIVILFIISIASLFFKGREEKNHHTPESMNEVYAEFARIIPPGWTLDSAENVFTFTRNDSVTYIGYHPNSMVKESEYRLKFEYSVEVQSQWTSEKQKTSEQFNYNIRMKTDSLHKAYSAMGLQVGFDDFYGQNEKERKLVSDYHQQRDSLESLIIRFPDINSGKYSVFITSNLPYFGCRPVLQPVGDEIDSLRTKIEAVFPGEE